MASVLPISRPAVSRHLRMLEGAELVAHTPKGTSNIFHLRREGFERARGWLGEFWDEAFDRFAELAEGEPEE